MIANPRSVMAYMDVPFSDPVIDDGGTDEQPVYDDFGHAHFTSTSKGYRSALALGKRSFVFTSPLQIAEEVKHDAFGDGMDLKWESQYRANEWHRTHDYRGPGLTGTDIMMRLTGENVALDCTGGPPLVHFQNMNRCQLTRFAGRDAAEAAAVFGGGHTNQCVSIVGGEFGEAALHAIGASNFESYSVMYERAKKGPCLYATAGDLVSGPITVIGSHYERDDMGPAFEIVGFGAVTMTGAELTCSRGIFRDCGAIVDEPNLFKYGAKFEYENCRRKIGGFGLKGVGNFTDRT